MIFVATITTIKEIKIGVQEYEIFLVKGHHHLFYIKGVRLIKTTLRTYQKKKKKKKEEEKLPLLGLQTCAVQQCHIKFHLLEVRNAYNLVKKINEFMFEVPALIFGKIYLPLVVFNICSLAHKYILVSF